MPAPETVKPATKQGQVARIATASPHLGAIAKQDGVGAKAGADDAPHTSHSHPLRSPSWITSNGCKPASTGSSATPISPLELDHWFCPDYVQLVDDQRLDRAAFEQHLLALRQSLARCEIRFVSLLAEGNRVHSLHRVRAWRHDGARIECKVSALFTFQGERLSHTDELTCLLAGSQPTGISAPASRPRRFPQEAIESVRKALKSRNPVRGLSATAAGPVAATGGPVPSPPVAAIAESCSPAAG